MIDTISHTILYLTAVFRAQETVQDVAVFVRDCLALPLSFTLRDGARTVLGDYTATLASCGLVPTAVLHLAVDGDAAAAILHPHLLAT